MLYNFHLSSPQSQISRRNVKYTIQPPQQPSPCSSLTHFPLPAFSTSLVRPPHVAFQLDKRRTPSWEIWFILYAFSCLFWYYSIYLIIRHQVTSFKLCRGHIRHYCSGSYVRAGRRLEWSRVITRYGLAYLTVFVASSGVWTVFGWDFGRLWASTFTWSWFEYNRAVLWALNYIALQRVCCREPYILDYREC